MHKFLFYNKFIIHLYMFRALCAHHQEVKMCIIQYLVSSHCVAGGRPVHTLREDSFNVRTGKPPTGVIIPDAVYTILTS